MSPETAVIGTASPNRSADLAYLGASEALVAFAARALSPVELLEALIERAAAVEPAVNAFAETMYDLARLEALDSERRWAEGTARPPEGLHGAAKEAQALAGHALPHRAPRLAVSAPGRAPGRWIGSPRPRPPGRASDCARQGRSATPAPPLPSSPACRC